MRYSAVDVIGKLVNSRLVSSCFGGVQSYTWIFYCGRVRRLQPPCCRGSTVFHIKIPLLFNSFLPNISPFCHILGSTLVGREGKALKQYLYVLLTDYFLVRQERRLETWWSYCIMRKLLINASETLIRVNLVSEDIAWPVFLFLEPNNHWHPKRVGSEGGMGGERRTGLECVE